MEQGVASSAQSSGGEPRPNSELEPESGSPRKLSALVIPCATAFISSLCVMVIELVAGRMIAGSLGASLYTWTSVIGIVMAGLAIGNYVGGLLADRFEVNRTLSALFMAASVASVFVAVSGNLVGDVKALWMFSWPARVVSHVALVFFLPSCVLGMIGPVAASRAVEVGQQAGRSIGSVYAWGVVGSILGTFATGFVLLAWLGTTAVIMLVASILAAIAIGYQHRSWKPWAWAASLGLIVALATGPAEALRAMGEGLALRRPIDDRVIYSTESQYSSIRVMQDPRDPNRREMLLDALLHSQIDMRDPLNLHYPFSNIFAAITKRLYPNSLRIDNLTIGGGGYVYPRYMSATYPEGRTDVIEIDPEVTRAAIEAFGLPADTPIRSFHEDARVFVDRLRQRREDGESDELYDIIYVDAFNHHSVPFQLTTLEFTQSIASVLDSQGAMLVHLIDTFDQSLFLGAVVNTIEKVFPHVYVFVEGQPVQVSAGERSSFVIAGTKRALDVSELDAGCPSECRIFALDDAERAGMSQRADMLVLTDAYSPVENLLAHIVDRHSVDRALGEWKQSIESAIVAQEYERALTTAREALEVFSEVEMLASDRAALMAQAAKAMRAKGLTDEARGLLERALDIYPASSRARLTLIDCYRDLGMLEESLPLYEGLLGYDPLVRYNYATLLAQLGHYPESAEQFRIVTEASPEFAPAHNNYGSVLRLMGRLESAAREFQRALQLEPGFSSARNNLALVVASLEEQRGE